MKKILIFVGIIVPAMAGIGQLHAARHTVGMNANIGGVCTIGTPTAVNGFTNGGSTLTATATAGKVDAKTATLKLPFTCTSVGVALQLTSANTGITKTVSGTVPSGQTNKIHYVATVNVNSSPNLGTLTTTGTTTGPLSTTLQTHTEAAGDVNLQVSIASGAGSSNTLMPGDYADSLHVDVLPNP